MLEIDFSDLRKFHMSAGIALMIAASLFVITNTYALQSERAQVMDLIYSNSSLIYQELNGKNYIQYRDETLAGKAEWTYNVGLSLFLIGGFSFAVGYARWIYTYSREYLKKNLS